MTTVIYSTDMIWCFFPSLRAGLSTALSLLWQTDASSPASKSHSLHSTTSMTHLHPLGNGQFCHSDSYGTLRRKNIAGKESSTISCSIVSFTNCYTKDIFHERAFHSPYLFIYLFESVVNHFPNPQVAAWCRVSSPEGWSRGPVPRPAGRRRLRSCSAPPSGWRGRGDTPPLRPPPGPQRSSPWPGRRPSPWGAAGCRLHATQGRR